MVILRVELPGHLVYLATAVFSVGPASKVSILRVSPIYRTALDLFCHSTELWIEWSHN